MVVNMADDTRTRLSAVERRNQLVRGGPGGVRREGVRGHLGRGDRRAGEDLQADRLRALRRQGGALRRHRRPRDGVRDRPDLRRHQPGTPRERIEGAALAFMRYVEERPDGFAVLSQDSPDEQRARQPARPRWPSGSATCCAPSSRRPATTPGQRRCTRRHSSGWCTFVGQWWRGEPEDVRRGGRLAHRRARVDGPATPAEATRRSAARPHERVALPFLRHQSRGIGSFVTQERWAVGGGRRARCR